MQQAVLLDPKAEYYALLGQVQRRNPQWKSGAVASFRDAVRCRPDDPNLRLSFAQILEEMGDRKQAGVQYRAALELRPNDFKLQEALELFENPPKPLKKSSGSLMASLRALLGRGERTENARDAARRRVGRNARQGGHAQDRLDRQRQQLRDRFRQSRQEVISVRLLPGSGARHAYNGGGTERSRRSLPSGRGKSELQRAACWLTARRGDATESATENRPPGSPSGTTGKGETVR